MKVKFRSNINSSTIQALFLSLLLFPVIALSQVSGNNLNIIPQPQSVTLGKGQFVINERTQIVFNDTRLAKTAAIFSDLLNVYSQKKLKTIFSKKQHANAINLLLLPQDNEAYKFVSTPSNVQISGGKRGVFYGVQTFLQLLPLERTPAGIPAVIIKDSPRFAHRGMLLDCGRHFFDTAFIKRFIDIIAFHKMNTFHWHLTEDQGWRIEIKKYPLLTKIGAWRDSTLTGLESAPNPVYEKKRYGGYYTQAEIKDIVQYAADRNINVMPEIEMPGHTIEVLAAYPRLACKSGSYRVRTKWGVSDDILCPTDSTFTFLENVLTEVMRLFPYAYIHVGGDETPKNRWKESAFCQQLIKEKGLKDEEELQNYFMWRIHQFLQSHNRKMVVWAWDGMAEGKYALPKDATVMHWQVEKPTGRIVAEKNYQVISVPGASTYFDYPEVSTDSLTMGGWGPLSTVYSFVPEAIEGLSSIYAKNIIGSQGDAWTEYMRWPSRVEYQILPRTAALAEVLWGKKMSYDNFLERLRYQTKRYDLFGWNYNKKAINTFDGSSKATGLKN